MIDIDKLTIGEIAKVEELSGQSVAVLGDEGAPMGKLLAALLFVNKRREHGPGYTWAQALDTPFPEVAAYLGINNDADEDQPVDVPDELAPVPNDEPTPRRLE